MLCKNKVADYAEWRQVFDSHAEAHSDSGIRLLHLLRDPVDPNMVVLLFKVDDSSKARAFVDASNVSESAERSGVIGQTEISFRTE
jgi:hypothetical protein